MFPTIPNLTWQISPLKILSSSTCNLHPHSLPPERFDDVTLNTTNFSSNPLTGVNYENLKNLEEIIVISI